jgi:membrane-bound lytic murein transglycosylase D
MLKTTSSSKGFSPVRFFRHAAGVAVFILFASSIMSFKYGGGTKTNKKAQASTPDSSLTNNSTKAFSNLLVDPLADNAAATRNLFKLDTHMQPFLKDYKRRETEEYEEMKVWGKRYLDLMDEILSKNGLPVQLKYLCVIESNLKAGTVSHSGATGPWQLMADEGRRYHLIMRKGRDERKDFEKSTETVAGLLKTLYDEFGDWLLVIAAYNCGTGAMRRALAKAGTSDYWVVQKYLSEQARNHVKKYIATHYIFEGCGGWTTITCNEAVGCRAAMASLNEQNTLNDSAFENNTISVEINGKYNSAVLINALFIDEALFNRLNPDLDKELLEGNTYHLTLPVDKIPLFQSNRKQILEQSVQLLLSSAVNK